MYFAVFGSCFQPKFHYNCGMLNKSNQKQYKQLYTQFEKAFYKMRDFAEKYKVEGIAESVHLIESIDVWGTEVEGCIDLNKENIELRAKLELTK